MLSNMQPVGAYGQLHISGPEKESENRFIFRVFVYDTSPIVSLCISGIRKNKSLIKRQRSLQLKSKRPFISCFIIFSFKVDNWRLGDFCLHTREVSSKLETIK